MFFFFVFYSDEFSTPQVNWLKKKCCCLAMLFFMMMSLWLVVSPHVKNMSQIGHLPPIFRVKIPKIYKIFETTTQSLFIVQDFLKPQVFVGLQLLRLTSHEESPWKSKESIDVFKGSMGKGLHGSNNSNEKKTYLGLSPHPGFQSPPGLLHF